LIVLDEFQYSMATEDDIDDERLDDLSAKPAAGLGRADVRTGIPGKHRR